MRLSRAAVLAVVLLALALPGGDVAAQSCPKGKLRFYTSWPMQGAMLPEGTGMKNGVDLAVGEVNGAVAGYCIEVVNLDDASPQTGKWDGAVEAENAETPANQLVGEDRCGANLEQFLARGQTRVAEFRSQFLARFPTCD